MGVFFERPAASGRSRTAVTSAIKEALLVDSTHLKDPDREVQRLADAATADAPAAQPQSFKTGRFAIALALVVLLVALGIWTDAQGYKASTKAIYGLASLAFGVIVGLLGGEKGSD